MGFPRAKRAFLVQAIGEERTALLEKGLKDAQDAAIAAGIEFKERTKSGDLSHLFDPLIAALKKIEDSIGPGKELAKASALHQWTKSLHEDSHPAAAYAADLFEGKVICK